MKSKKFLAKLMGMTVIACGMLSSNVAVLASSLTTETIIGSTQVSLIESTVNNNQLVLSASGGKMQTSDDNIEFAYVPVKGDFVATMKIAKVENASSKTRAYLMVRNGLASDAAHISAGIKSSSSGYYEARLGGRTSGSLDNDLGSYVRIEKSGTTYTISTSDSSDFSNATVERVYDNSSSKNNTDALEADTLNVGLAVCSGVATVDYFNIVDASGNTVYSLTGDQSETDKPETDKPETDKPETDEGEEEVVATIVGVETLSDITVTQNGSVSLPSKVTATYSDGTTKEVSVNWSSVNTSQVGTQTVWGSIDGYSNGITVTVNVVAAQQTPVSKDVIYASPNGSASAEGTMKNPMSFEAALTSVKAGGTIYMVGGTYYFDHQITIADDNNGTAGSPKSIVALNGADVTLDFSAESYNSADTSLNDRGLQINGSYWYVKGVTVTGAADNGFYITGKHNTLELCKAVANRDTGIQIGRAKSTLTDFNSWPSDNLVLNCTSYNNSDPATGENADGFAAKLTCGNNNVFDGCIAYNNVDDGWDLYTKPETGAIGPVTLRNCIAFRNGATVSGQFTANSDGNGFKLGGKSIAVPHIVENCIAFENKNHGFTDNSNPGTITLTNCTSFNNSLDTGKKSNFDFARDKSKSYNILVNCMSFSTEAVSSDKYIGEAENSVFFANNKYYGFTEREKANSTSSSTRGTEITGPTKSDFVSLSSPALGADVHKLWRNADGSVNIGNFLKIANSSAFAGRNIGADLD